MRLIEGCPGISGFLWPFLGKDAAAAMEAVLTQNQHTANNSDLGMAYTKCWPALSEAYRHSSVCLHRSETALSIA